MPRSELPRALLVVDADATVRHALQRQLIASGYVVWEAEDGSAALELLARTPIDVVLTEIELPPQMDGPQLLEHVRVSCPNAVRLLMTAGVQPGAILATPVLQKPFRSHDLASAVDRELAARALPTTDSG